MKEQNINGILSQQEHNASQVDELLKSLVMVSEKTSVEIGITLNVNGLLITGFLISQESYFDKLTQRIQSTESDSEAASTLVDFLKQLKHTLLEKSSDEKNGLLPFIHLRDAKIYPSEGEGMPSFGHALWRGDIRAVNGFSLGEMVPAHIKNTVSEALSP